MTTVTRDPMLELRRRIHTLGLQLQDHVISAGGVEGELVVLQHPEPGCYIDTGDRLYGPVDPYYLLRLGAPR